MNIVIIEDEKLTAGDLADTISAVDPAMRIAGIVHSVKEAISWFGRNEKPDLVFSDIQLGDGLSFEIFKNLTFSVPVIFCTAHDEYALSAFKANGIDYILKPFSQQTISDALKRYRELKNTFSRNMVQYETIAELFGKRKSVADSSVLVYNKDKILPVKINEIALFYIENEINHLVTFGQKTYSINKTMEELEKVTGTEFFRVNRKFLINRNAIKDAAHYFHRKLVVNLSVPFSSGEPITVSKLKAGSFLHWLAGN
jgi:two-component system, LytTR family, response regulator LytT